MVDVAAPHVCAESPKMESFDLPFLVAFRFLTLTLSSRRGMTHSSILAVISTRASSGHAARPYGRARSVADDCDGLKCWASVSTIVRSKRIPAFDADCTEAMPTKHRGLPPMTTGDTAPGPMHWLRPLTRRPLPERYPPPSNIPSFGGFSSPKGTRIALCCLRYGAYAFYDDPS